MAKILVWAAFIIGLSYVQPFCYMAQKGATLCWMATICAAFIIGLSCVQPFCYMAQKGATLCWMAKICVAFC